MCHYQWSSCCRHRDLRFRVEMLKLCSGLGTVSGKDVFNVLIFKPSNTISHRAVLIFFYTVNMMDSIRQYGVVHTD